MTAHLPSVTVVSIPLELLQVNYFVKKCCLSGLGDRDWNGLVKRLLHAESKVGLS